MAKTTDTSIVIADDHPLVVEMLARVVQAEPGFELVARCATAAAALAAIRDHTPDVAVLDVTLPDGRGTDVVQQLREGGATTRVVFLTGTSDAHTLYECIVSGAQGFLSKAVGRHEIVAAVRKVAAGGTVFPPEASDVLQAREGAPRKPILLSPRERHVLELAAQGHSSAEIARLLYVGQTTVKTHLRHAAEKLHVRGKAATVAEAMRRGLIG